MPKFQVHTIATAPGPAKEILQGYQEKFGFVPNLASIMAQSPATLKGYATCYGLLAETDFTPAEQQLILLAVSRENKCTYCVAAHSVVGKMMGLDDLTITAVRDGTPVLDAKMAAIVDFATKVVIMRGFVSKDDIRDFLAAGHSQAQILEVLLGVATKTISNYMNHMANTPLDEAFAPMAWEPSASS